MGRVTKLRKFFRCIPHVVVPILILSVTFTVYFIFPDFLYDKQRMIIGIAFIVLLLTLFLCLIFNKSNIFFIVVSMLVTQLAVLYYPHGDTWQTNFLHWAAAFLLYLNIVVLGISKERGIISPWGKVKIGFLLLEVCSVTYMLRWGAKEISWLLDCNALQGWRLGPLFLSRFAIISLCFFFLLILAKWFICKNLYDMIYIWIFIGMIPAVYTLDLQHSIPFIFLGVAVMLALYIIISSYTMAYMDELTGLPARRALREELLKLGNRYCIAMLDIDFFKKFNDSYGHDAGDEVLKLVAVHMASVGGGGKPFRYGGEEFAIVFPNRNVSEAIPHLEELREGISKVPYSYSGKTKKDTKIKGRAKKLFVTVSIGVSERKDREQDPDTVMKNADKALYKAKKKGRNCVCKI